MKIITLERRTLDGEPINQDALRTNTDDYRDWWCVIETKEEELVYDKAFHTPINPANAKRTLVQGVHRDLWNELVKHAGRPQGLCWGDDDVYGYLRPDEAEPEIGEEFEDADGDKWVRVA